MNKNTPRVIGVIILVIILALAGYFYNKRYKLSHPAKTVAQQGKVISGFPQELLLGASNAKIEQSYSLDYGSAAQQYTATFSIEKAMPLEALLYHDYFKKAGYYIANEHTDEANNFANLYATKDNVDVNVVIQRRSDKKTIDVTVSYVVKGN